MAGVSAGTDSCCAQTSACLCQRPAACFARPLQSSLLAMFRAHCGQRLCLLLSPGATQPKGQATAHGPGAVQVSVDVPDVKGRTEILKVHARNKKLAEEVSLEEIAQRTPGFSGADLANLLNEVRGAPALLPAWGPPSAGHARADQACRQHTRPSLGSACSWPVIGGGSWGHLAVHHLRSLAPEPCTAAQCLHGCIHGADCLLLHRLPS